MALNKKVVVSSCLLGKKCRFDGGTCTHTELIEDLANVDVIPVCPEEMGGLETPRPRARIVGKSGSSDGFDVLNGEAKVLTHEDADVTNKYIKGGKLALELAKSSGVELAILKANSPSCGCGKIFTEDFKSLKAGDGTTTALFKSEGIKVVDENDYFEAIGLILKK